ncbi:hypothetical protein BH09SUM1_BH09SUM1_02960 [soil metagenome]
MNAASRFPQATRSNHHTTFDQFTDGHSTVSRHKCHRTRLNRSLGHRTATLRNLTRSLILQEVKGGGKLERIETTAVKAKTLRPWVEKLITLGKKGTLHHRRQAFAQVACKDTVHQVFEVLAKRYADRTGGYTRIILGRRREGDGAEMAYIELVGREVAAEPAAAEEKTAGAEA